MVKGHLDVQFQFYPLLESDKPGWWSKIELFKPGRFTGRVLYLDLDVSVVGALDDLVALPEPFVIAKDWVGTKKIGKYNSSVMVWDAGELDHVNLRWTPDVMQRMRGDQNWIEECVPEPALFPRAWVRSFKADVRNRLDGSLPNDCRVVVYHGRPKPWTVECAS